MLRFIFRYVGGIFFSLTIKTIAKLFLILTDNVTTCVMMEFTHKFY